MNIGFSTGSIAYGDFRAALEMLANQDTIVVELSALREEELDQLIGAMDTLDLAQFEYISFHAPSKLRNLTEEYVVDRLCSIADRNWPIVVHPDTIQDYALWRDLGAHLCIENMDKRKACGRTAMDLQLIFEQLPEASFCLDVAHARQVDPSLSQCYQMLKQFGGRLVQIHLSDVTSESKHVPLNLEALNAYKRIIQYVPDQVPVILESPILPGENQKARIANEIQVARSLFTDQLVFI